MPTRMKWKQLLCDDRYSTGTGKRPPSEQNPAKINSFQEDSERIIYPSAFRRLQGKTQVQPLPRIDYVRTRLTHTMEVASAARLIANICGRYIVSNDDTVNWKKEFQRDPIGLIIDVCVSAALAHDIGNPPFGHIGEYAIQSYFKEKKDEGGETFSFLRDDQRAYDFTSFDGNSQGFRILTKLQGWRGRGGLQLSYGVLGAFSKYPFSSIVGALKYGKDKFGFMHADRAAASQIFTELGMGRKVGLKLQGLTADEIDNLEKRKVALEFSRHPLAWIVEAADDICYRTTDIEDAYRYKSISFEEAEKILKPLAESRGHMPRYADIPEKSYSDRLTYLRAGAVSALIEGCSEAFISSYDLIMDGRNETSLIMKSPFKEKVREIKALCEMKVYVQRDKMEVEAAGCHVIQGLIHEFGQMVVDLMGKKSASRLNMKGRALFNLLPLEYQMRLESGDGYESFLVIVDYVSGMTDNYALELYQKITGTSVSLGRML